MMIRKGGSIKVVEAMIAPILSDFHVGFVK